MFFISCLVSKSSSSGIVGAVGRVKIIFSSGKISSFGFSYSNTPSISPIKQSPLILCVVFVPKFDEALAVDGLFREIFLANPLIGRVAGAGGTLPLEKSKLKSLLLRN